MRICFCIKISFNVNDMFIRRIYYFYYLEKNNIYLEIFINILCRY